MKTTLLLCLSFICINSYSKEILCIPDATSAPFDSVELTKIKGNKYSLVVKKDNQILLNDQLSYTFLRRDRYGRFRNKEQNVTIKTKKLFVNSPQRSSLKFDKIENAAYPGLCKLY